MSKIAEQKALEAYPQEYDNLLDANVNRRIGYRQGYDQAMQDFMEKAEDAISMISRHYVVEDYTFDQIWEQFKTICKNEM